MMPLLQLPHLGYKGVANVDVDPWGGVDPGIMELKKWKAVHKLGTLDVVPGEILGPDESYRARPFDDAHCDILEEKLKTMGSSNSKGVKLVVFSAPLETEWLAADKATKEALFKKGTKFYEAVSALAKHAIGGDHTRTAVARLNARNPAVEKWTLLKKVTILLVGHHSTENHANLRDLGVMYNAKQYHKDMGYADRMIIIHKYYEEQGMLAKNKHRTKIVKVWCARQCALAGVPENSWSQYAAAARLDGEAWKYMEAILLGKYGLKIGKGHIPATIPVTQSPFIKLLCCPDEIVVFYLKQVYEGKLSIPSLNNSAENYRAFALTKLMVCWAVEQNTLTSASEESVEKAWPQLMTDVFIRDQVTGIKALSKTNKKIGPADCPLWLREKVVCHIQSKANPVMNDRPVNSHFVFLERYLHPQVCRLRHL